MSTTSEARSGITLVVVLKQLTIGLELRSGLFRAYEAVFFLPQMVFASDRHFLKEKLSFCL